MFLEAGLDFLLHIANVELVQPVDHHGFTTVAIHMTGSSLTVAKLIFEILTFNVVEHFLL